MTQQQYDQKKQAIMNKVGVAGGGRYDPSADLAKLEAEYQASRSDSQGGQGAQAGTNPTQTNTNPASTQGEDSGKIMTSEEMDKMQQVTNPPANPPINTNPTTGTTPPSNAGTIDNPVANSYSIYDAAEGVNPQQKVSTGNVDTEFARQQNLLKDNFKDNKSIYKDANELMAYKEMTPEEFKQWQGTVGGNVNDILAYMQNQQDDANRDIKNNYGTMGGALLGSLGDINRRFNLDKGKFLYESSLGDRNFIQNMMRDNQNARENRFTQALGSVTGESNRQNDLRERNLNRSYDEVGKDSAMNEDRFSKRLESGQNMSQFLMDLVQNERNAVRGDTLSRDKMSQEERIIRDQGEQATKASKAGAIANIIFALMANSGGKLDMAQIQKMLDNAALNPTATPAGV